MRCPHCGKFVSAGIARCPSCKKPIAQAKGIKSSVNQPPPQKGNSWVLFVVCLLFGYLGVHRFMEGKVKTGILWLLTGGVCGIGWVVDIIILLTKCAEVPKAEPQQPQATPNPADLRQATPSPTDKPQPTPRLTYQPNLTVRPTEQSHQTPEPVEQPQPDRLEIPDVVVPLRPQVIINDDDESDKKSVCIETPVSNYTVIDTETTGLGDDDRIVQFSALRVRGDEIVDTYSTYINPQWHISKQASEVNGITDDDLRDLPTFDHFADEILEFISDDCIVAHNATFDLRMLNSDLVRSRRQKISNDYIDTVALARLINKPCGNRLPDLCDFFGITGFGFHDALEDCKATHQLYQRLKPYQIYESDLTYRIASDKWGEWNKKLPQARERQRAGRAAKCQVISIDKSAQTAEFLGSTGDTYSVSLGGCTCPDFTDRQRPCKHMYRLAAELGLVEIVEENNG